MAIIDNSTNLINSIPFTEQTVAPTTPPAGERRVFTKADGLYTVDSAGVVVGPFIVAGGAGYTNGARVYNNADISVANGALVALTFNTERFDTDTIHDTGTNTGRLTCKTAGVYLITANIAFDVNSTGHRDVYLRVNGTTIMAATVQPALALAGNIIVCSTHYSLAVNDYVEVVVYQNSGGALNVLYLGDYTPEFMMQRIG